MTLLFSVAVKINHVLYFFVSGKISNELLDLCDFWRELLGRATLTFIVSSPHCRLRSSPAMLHLDMPWITPSGFTIGTIMNSNFCKRYFMVLLFCRSWRITYSAIKDPVVSQGCCRAIINTISLDYFSSNIFTVGMILLDIE